MKYSRTAASIAIVSAALSCDADRSARDARDGGVAGGVATGGSGGTRAGTGGSAAGAGEQSTGPHAAARTSADTRAGVNLPPSSAHAPESDIDWEGWHVHPALLWSGCRGTYVPDDPAKRVPPLKWESCESMVCQRLVIDWDFRAGDQTGLSFEVRGSGPSTTSLAKILSKDVVEHVLFKRVDGSYIPTAAFRLDSRERGGVPSLPRLTFDGSGAFFSMTLFEECGGEFGHMTFQAPVADPSQLMASATPTVGWTWEFLGGRISTLTVGSESTLAAWLEGPVARAEWTDSGSTPELVAPPTGVDGAWSDPVVSGDDVFVHRWREGFDGGEIWVSSGSGPVVPLIQHPGSVYGFATDGQRLIWSVSSEPTADVPPRDYTKYELYVAPYTTDRSKLVPQKLTDLPDPFGALKLNAGYVAGGRFDEPPKRRQFVVRLADGQVFEIVLPSKWRAMSTGHPAADEVWMRIYDGEGNSPIIRLPYSALVPRDGAQ